MLPTCAAPASTERSDTTPVGKSTVDASASTESSPAAVPRVSPRPASTTGAGTVPEKLDGTELWLAESGFGNEALMRLTRVVMDRCPKPPSEPALPSTGLPPDTIMPASGWNAFTASTAVLHACVALGSGMLHCGSCPARGVATSARTVIVIEPIRCIAPPLVAAEAAARHYR